MIEELDLVVTNSVGVIIKKRNGFPLHKIRPGLRTPALCVSYLRNIRYLEDRREVLNKWVPWDCREYCRDQLELEGL